VAGRLRDTHTQEPDAGVEGAVVVVGNPPRPVLTSPSDSDWGGASPAAYSVGKCLPLARHSPPGPQQACMAGGEVGCHRLGSVRHWAQSREGRGGGWVGVCGGGKRAGPP
jgi:hypothetical protein